MTQRLKLIRTVVGNCGAATVYRRPDGGLAEVWVRDGETQLIELTQHKAAAEPDVMHFMDSLQERIDEQKRAAPIEPQRRTG